MKKISLKNLNLHEVEKLSREQLKDVLGGIAIVTVQCHACEDPAWPIPCGCLDGSKTWCSSVDESNPNDPWCNGGPSDCGCS